MKDYRHSESSRNVIEYSIFSGKLLLITQTYHQVVLLLLTSWDRPRKCLQWKLGNFPQNFFGIYSKNFEGLTLRKYPVNMLSNINMLQTFILNSKRNINTIPLILNFIAMLQFVLQQNLLKMFPNQMMLLSFVVFAKKL